MVRRRHDHDRLGAGRRPLPARRRGGVRGRHRRLPQPPGRRDRPATTSSAIGRDAIHERVALPDGVAARRARRAPPRQRPPGGRRSSARPTPSTAAARSRSSMRDRDGRPIDDRRVEELANRVEHLAAHRVLLQPRRRRDRPRPRRRARCGGGSTGTSRCRSSSCASSCSSEHDVAGRRRPDLGRRSPPTSPTSTGSCASCRASSTAPSTRSAASSSSSDDCRVVARLGLTHERTTDDAADPTARSSTALTVDGTTFARPCTTRTRSARRPASRWRRHDRVRATPTSRTVPADQDRLDVLLRRLPDPGDGRAPVQPDRAGRPRPGAAPRAAVGVGQAQAVRVDARPGACRRR